MRTKRFFRAVSIVLLVTIGSMTMQPLQAAIQIERAQAKNAPAPKAADEKYGDALREIEEQSLKAKKNRKAGKSSKAEAKAIRSFVKGLDALEGDVEAGFAATEKHLRDKKLAQVILDRHNAAVTTFRQKRDEFQALMKAVDSADNNAADIEIDSALTSLGDFLEKHSQMRKRARLDPNKLPWRTPDVTKRLPITDAKAFKTARFGYEPTLVAGAVPAGTAMPKALSAKPTAEDLAETEDAQVTPAIRAKAQELGNDPLTIYLWVRNNVRFTPTYGSIQGSQDTLDKLSGNAFDTASLLIALLRAANVPARYAYGTIDVPVDQAMNWVGGVTKVEAAQQVLGQGGIPNVPVISGGVVRHIRMEHIWVESWVDYLPSRGAQHVEGDTWISIDASFKQYAFTQGMNLQATVPFDTSAYAASAQAGATSNATEGWVQNLNHKNVWSGLTAYERRVETYVKAQKPNPTLGDVVGSQTIVASSPAVFLGALPYRTVARGPVYAALPAELRHQFQYRLFASAIDRLSDSPVWTFQRSLPRLAGKRVTLSFRPSTQADADLIASYLPQPHSDGTPIRVDELPSTLPAHVRVTSELRIDEEVVASGGSFSLGTELAALGGFTKYDFSDWDLTPDDTHVAGQTSALGLSIQGVSTAQILALHQRMTQTRAKLAAGDLSGLSADRVSGDILTATIWRYYVGLEHHGQVSKGPADVIDQPALSYGLFHAGAKPNKLFGVVTTSVTFRRVMMDVGHLRHLRISKTNDSAAWVRYNRDRGVLASAMEHAVPEAVLTDSEGSFWGVSATKALTLAAEAGQKIFTVTAQNQAAVLPQLAQSSSVIDDIQNSIAAGKEVVISQAPIVSQSWQGAGYFVVDPATGAGAYLIEGGANGLEGSLCNSLVLSLQILMITALVLALIAAAAAALPLVVAGAAWLAQAGSIIAAAVASLPVQIKTAVSASLMLMVSFKAAAGDVLYVCRLLPGGIMNGECAYWCLGPDGLEYPHTQAPPRNYCGNFEECPGVVPAPR